VENDLYFAVQDAQMNMRKSRKQGDAQKLRVFVGIMKRPSFGYPRLEIIGLFINAVNQHKTAF
jgi:hypothetical protein